MTTGLLNALVAEDLPGPGSVFLQVSWRFLAPVRPGDVLTAEARVLEVRADKPVTTLETTVRTGDGTLVIDGTAVVWRDPVVAARSTADTAPWTALWRKARSRRGRTGSGSAPASAPVVSAGRRRRTTRPR